VTGWAPVPPDSQFPIENLPLGVVRSTSGDGRARVATRIGDHVLPVADVPHDVPTDVFEQPSLNAFLALGPDAWQATRDALTAFLTDSANARPLLPVDAAEMLVPIEVGDYVDFYSSLQHATNLGRLFRPDSEPLLPNWRRLPVGYHGRAGTVVVSGTPLHRPSGLVVQGEGVVRAPSGALDIELEVGFVVGGPGNQPGVPIRPDEADRHVFGAVLLNDWSARDIQAYEYQPLGPFLGKSFLTTISPWVVPLAALAPFLVDAPAQDPAPDPFLRAARPWAIDLELAVDLAPAGGAPTTITRTNFRHLYWTFAQQLAHLTSNGATTRAGDLFGSGTVSGPEPSEYGSLLELTWRGRDPLPLADGSTRTFLQDGDTVTLRGWCRRAGARPTIGFGQAVGTVGPARPEAV
jgi:fumarylacetoacetase